MPGGVLRRLVQPGRGERWAEPSAGAVLWLAPPCRGEPSASREPSRGEGVPEGLPREPLARASPRLNVRFPRRGGEGRRAPPPGSPPRGPAGARSASRPPRRSSPTTAFRDTRAPRSRTPAAGATRIASRRARSRLRPAAPRRNARPRGTRWCSREPGARRRGCGWYPATRERPRPPVSRRERTCPRRARTRKMLRATPGMAPALPPPCPVPTRTRRPGAPRRRVRCRPAAVPARSRPRGHRTVSIRPQR